MENYVYVHWGASLYTRFTLDTVNWELLMRSQWTIPKETLITISLRKINLNLNKWCWVFTFFQKNYIWKYYQVINLDSYLEKKWSLIQNLQINSKNKQTNRQQTQRTLHLQIKHQVMEALFWYAVMKPHCNRRKKEKEKRVCYMYANNQL